MMRPSGPGPAATSFGSAGSSSLSYARPQRGRQPGRQRGALGGFSYPHGGSFAKSDASRSTVVAFVSGVQFFGGHITFVTMTSFSLFLVFMPSALSLMCLGMDPEQNFWFAKMDDAATSYVYVILGCVLLLILAVQHLLHLRRGRPSRDLIMVCVVFPALFFGMGCGKFAHSLFLIATRLEDSDCETYREKFELQQNYEVALGHWEECRQSAAAEGVPPEPTVETCPTYEEAEANVGEGELQGWRYLGRLEREFNCASFCTGGQSLWVHGSSTRYYSLPPCNKPVAWRLFTLSKLAFFTKWYSLSLVPFFLVFDPIFLGPLVARLSQVRGVAVGAAATKV